MKKGQAAIEFLITYGWAIMAAVIVIGALTYFGMTNPSSSLPDKCIFSNVFECKDHYVNRTALRVKLSNANSETIYAPNATSNITAFLTDSPTIRCNATQVAALEPEGQIEITCSNLTAVGGPFAAGDKAKIKVSLYYANKPSGYMQISLGEVYSTVQ